MHTQMYVYIYIYLYELHSALCSGFAAQAFNMMMMMMNLLLNYSNKKSHETLRTPKTPTVQHHLKATADPRKRLPQSQTLYKRNRWLAEWNQGRRSEQTKQLASLGDKLKARKANHFEEEKKVTSTGVESSRQLCH